MTEHNYPECTTSSITALAIFRKHYPKYRTAEIECVVFHYSLRASIEHSYLSQSLYTESRRMAPRRSKA